MRTFFDLTSAARHRLRAAVSVRLSACDPRRQDGFLLIEVMISAVLVALIATATFNGLDVATRVAADQRHHDQAALLAAQSQEQLRTEPASALDVLETHPHKYSVKVNGTTYTITQEAKAVSASGNTTGCSVSESAAQTGANILITSKVTWPQQVGANRPAVKEASVITPPTGSAIEVDVLNGQGGGVEGVTAKAEFIPNEAGSYNTVEGTTDAAGCVVLAGIQATSAKVYIVEKPGFVTPTGALKVEPKQLTIAPNITTHYAVKYAEAGRIQAQYTYKGATSFGGKEVKNDTFVAFNSETGVKPEYESGSTAFEYKAEQEEPYRALTGTYANFAYTAAGAKYGVGRLFPFKAGWSAWAGDCPANKLSSEVSGIVVHSGETTTVQLPLSYTTLSVYTGIAATQEPGELIKTPIKEAGKNVVKITDTSCAGAEKGLHEYSPSYVHEQKEVLAEGRLENPFQPFGSFSLCVYEPTLKKSFTTTYTNGEAAGSTPAIYLKQKTTAEKTAEITAANEAKATREKEETEATAAKETRANEEAAAKTAETERKADEKGPESKAYWEKLKAEGKITAAQLTTKEKTKATLEKEEKEGKITKATREAAEKTTETKAYWERLKTEGKLTAAQLTLKEKTKATLAAEETAAASAKATRVSEESAAETAKANRASAESAAKAAEEERKKRETAEAANKVTVESQPC